MSAALSRVEAREITREFSNEQLHIIKEQVAAGLNDGEFALFIEVCKRSGLDPFRKQIYAIKRIGRNGNPDKVAHQTGIDGFRLIAVRSGEYEGQLGPFWCGNDGEWKDAWTSNAPIAAAKVGVLRRGFREPLWAVARFKSYEQDSPLWRKMPEVMIAKCAEALAIRKAFPEDLSGLYAEEEMQQADDAPAYVERAKPLQQLEQPRTPPADSISPAGRATFDAFAERFTQISKDGTRKDFQSVCASVKGAHLPQSLHTELLVRAKATDAILKARAQVEAEKARSYEPKSDADEGPNDGEVA